MFLRDSLYSKVFSSKDLYLDAQVQAHAQRPSQLQPLSLPIQKQLDITIRLSLSRYLLVVVLRHSYVLQRARVDASQRLMRRS